MRWMLCVLIVCRVGVAAADDDDREGGVFAPGHPVQWRVKVDFAEKSHRVIQNSPQSARMTMDETATLNGTYVVEIDSAAVAGPDYTVGVDTESKATASNAGGGTISDQTTLEDGHDTLKGHGNGSLASMTMSFTYMSRSKKFLFSLAPKYRESGVDPFGKTSPPSVGGIMPVELGDMFKTRVGTLTMTGKKFAVDFDYSGGPAEAHVDEHLHVTMEPLQESKYIAVLRPADRDAYAKWVPLGPTIPGNDETKGGNDLELVLEVRDKATNKVSIVPYSAVWSIASTRLPGWCMNYPKKADANDHWDLYFDGAKNNKTWKVQQDGEQLIVGATRGEQHAIVSSRDYGGHAVVSATVAVDGATLIAHEDIGKTTYGEAGIRVPKDDNQNHIADAWEADNHAKDKDATDDDDVSPAGMFNKGDGLDVFEEYRGFAVLDPVAVMNAAATGKMTTKIAFQRLDPTVKEVFVMLEGQFDVVPALLYGAMRFAEVTKLTMYFVPSAELLEPMAGDMDDKHPRTLTTRIDPSDADFGLPQAAVWVTASTKPGSDSSGYTGFVASGDPDAVAVKHHGSPTQVKGVQIFPANVHTQMKFWISIWDKPDEHPFNKGRLDLLAKEHPDWHLTPAALQDYATKHFTELEQNFLAWTTMHELGHALGARHHNPEDLTTKDTSKTTGSGAATCPMRYWNDADPVTVILFLTGHWRLTDNAPTGERWQFCSEDWPDMRVWQQPEDLDQRGKH